MPADARALVELMAKALTDKPSEIEIDAFDDGPEHVVELGVAEEDMGRVIGKSGRTARALRTILGAAGRKADKQFVLDILD
jgi:uncharacterized protein